MFVYNKPQLQFYRKALRNNATLEERLLWERLKKRQLLGFKFIRQYSVENYILDFYCPKVRLGIELDGKHHSERDIAAFDYVRTIHLKDFGIKIIRFENEEILNRFEEVLGRIKKELLIKEEK